MTVRRTPPRLLAVAAVVALAAAVAGCGLLRRPEIRHFALEPIAPAAAPAAAVAGPPLGVDAIELPPGLDRRGLVVRRDDHRLEVRGTDLWAASLESMVLHTLAFDLAHRLPEGTVILPGQAQPPGGMRSLDVAFEELAAGPERQVVVDTRWTLRSPGAADLVGHHDARCHLHPRLHTDTQHPHAPAEPDLPGCTG
ncbi:MAG TPA: ABC-type transport auxiliary lipoprotein family protein, partial [Thermoanaerobaculia bacterium]